MGKTKKEIETSIFNGILIGIVNEPSCVSDYIKELNEFLKDKSYIEELLSKEIQITEEQLKDYFKNPSIKEKLENQLEKNFKFLDPRLNKLNIFTGDTIKLLECYKKYIKSL